MQSFLHSLSNQYYDNQNQLKLIDIQLHIINTQYLSLPQFKLLFDLIKQSKISISNLIVPYEIALSQSQISQIMSIKESTKIKTKISFYILSSSSDQNTLKSNINTNTNSRRLLSNESDISLLQPLMTQIDIIEKESWVCEPWPIYVGFFSGIGVTVLITLAINFTLGDNDKQLNSALERIITAGIYHNIVDMFKKQQFLFQES